MINNLQSSKWKTKLIFYHHINNYFVELNYRRQSGTFQFVEHVFSGNAQGIGKSMPEILLLMFFYTLSHGLRKWMIVIMICIILFLTKEMKVLLRKFITRINSMIIL